MKYISVENFRVFDTPTKIDIKPITCLIGPNSSGKSSFIRLIEILKALLGSSLYNSNTRETALSNIEEFELQKIIGSLGDFSKVLASNSNSPILKIGIPFDYQYVSSDCELQLSYEINKKKKNNSASLTSFSIYENSLQTYIFQLVFEEGRWITKFINFPLLKEKYLKDLSLLGYQPDNNSQEQINTFDLRSEIGQLRSLWPEHFIDIHPVSDMIFFDEESVELIDNNITSNGTDSYLGTQSLFLSLEDKVVDPERHLRFWEILSKNNIGSINELRKRIQYEEEILLQRIPITNFDPYEQKEEIENTIDHQINLYNRNLPRLLKILVKKFGNRKELLKSLGLDYSIVLEISKKDYGGLMGNYDYYGRGIMINDNKASMLQVLSKVYLYHFLGLSLNEVSKKLNNTDIIKAQRSSGFRSFRYAYPETEFQKVI